MGEWGIERELNELENALHIQKDQEQFLAAHGLSENNPYCCVIVTQS